MNLTLGVVEGKHQLFQWKWLWIHFEMHLYFFPELKHLNSECLFSGRIQKTQVKRRWSLGKFQEMLWTLPKLKKIRCHFYWNFCLWKRMSTIFEMELTFASKPQSIDRTKFRGPCFLRQTYLIKRSFSGRDCGKKTQSLELYEDNDTHD